MLNCELGIVFGKFVEHKFPIWETHKLLSPSLWREKEREGEWERQKMEGEGKWRERRRFEFFVQKRTYAQSKKIKLNSGMLLTVDTLTK